MKFKKLLGAGLFLSALSLGVSIITFGANKASDAKQANADTYQLNTYQNVMLFRKFTKYNWNKDGAKTAVKFTDDYNHECWSKIVSDADVFKGGGSGNDEYIDYFIYPEVTEHQWTKFQFARIDSSATSNPWDHVWNWAQIKDFEGYNNTFAPLDYSDSNVNFYRQDIESETFNGGDTIYIRDTDDGAWTTDSHYLQVHLWGNSLMQGDRYINATKVEGYYNDELTNPVVSLYEAVIPNDAGRYKWFQLKRINPATSQPSNQSSDFEVDTSKNVFEYSGTGWDGGVMAGKFAWNIEDAGRVNIFSRYIVSQTAARCTSQYYDINTAADFKTAWDNIKPQYEHMSTRNQGTFYTASATEASYPGKGALRYDYLVWKYKLENFVNRSSSFRAVSVPLIFQSENANNIMIVVIISVVSLTAVGGYIFLKRRKEN